MCVITAGRLARLPKPKKHLAGGGCVKPADLVAGLPVIVLQVGHAGFDVAGCLSGLGMGFLNRLVMTLWGLLGFRETLLLLTPLTGFHFTIF